MWLVWAAFAAAIASSAVVEADGFCQRDDTTLVKAPYFIGTCQSSPFGDLLVPAECRPTQTFSIAVTQTNSTDVVREYGGSGSSGDAVAFKYVCKLIYSKSDDGATSMNYAVKITGCVVNGKDLNGGETAAYGSKTMLCINNGTKWSMSTQSQTQVVQPSSTGQGQYKEGDKESNGAWYFQYVGGSWKRIGCVIQNGNGDDTPLEFGKKLVVPGTYEYSCSIEKKGDQESYSLAVTGCATDDGKLVEPGKTFKNTDGSSIFCKADSDGRIYRVVQTVVSMQSYTENGVRYVFKDGGFVATACYPNGDDSLVVAFGESKTIGNLKYECSKSGFNPVACISSNGKDIPIGSKLDINNATITGVEICRLNNATGAVEYRIQYKMVNKVKGACLMPTGDVVKSDGVFVVKKPLAAVPGAFYFVYYRCLPSDYNIYNSPATIEPIGCDVGQEGTLGFGEVAKYKGKFFMCIRESTGHVHLDEIQADAVSCKYNGRTYKQNEIFIGDNNSTQYRCNRGQLVKYACIARGKILTLGTYAFYCGDDPFYCPPQGSGAIQLGVKGCYVDGKLVHFLKQVERTKGSFFTCGYTFTKDLQVVTHLTPDYCVIPGTSNGLVAANQYSKYNGKWYFCEYFRETDKLILRELTVTEAKCAADTKGDVEYTRKCIIVWNGEESGGNAGDGSIINGNGDGNGGGGGGYGQDTRPTMGPDHDRTTTKGYGPHVEPTTTKHGYGPNPEPTTTKDRYGPNPEPTTTKDGYGPNPGPTTATHLPHYRTTVHPDHSDKTYKPPHTGPTLHPPHTKPSKKPHTGPTSSPDDSSPEGSHETGKTHKHHTRTTAVPGPSDKTHKPHTGPTLHPPHTKPSRKPHTGPTSSPDDSSPEGSHETGKTHKHHTRTTAVPGPSDKTHKPHTGPTLHPPHTKPSKKPHTGPTSSPDDSSPEGSHETGKTHKHHTRTTALPDHTDRTHKPFTDNPYGPGHSPTPHGGRSRSPETTDGPDGYRTRTPHPHNVIETDECEMLAPLCLGTIISSFVDSVTTNGDKTLVWRLANVTTAEELLQVVASLEKLLGSSSTLTAEQRKELNYIIDVVARKVNPSYDGNCKQVLSRCKAGDKIACSQFIRSCNAKQTSTCPADRKASCKKCSNPAGDGLEISIELLCSGTCRVRHDQFGKLVAQLTKISRSFVENESCFENSREKVPHY